ncbi:MAG: hypothetical protein LUH02_01375 [Erysipelotrichaceae bacterium]|nr:hypothetical protein [Erysipelotrichaceae bacterium]
MMDKIKNHWKIILIVIIVLVVVVAAVAYSQPSNDASNDDTNTSSDVVDEDNTEDDESTTSKSNDSSDSESNNATSSSSISSSSSFFPYTSSIDGLQLEGLYLYSGYYIEDGSEDAIDNVAVLQVTNVSGKDIEYAIITLQADDETLTFNVSLLPNDGTAIVMEANKQTCDEDAKLSYGGSEIATLSSMDLCKDQVSIKEDNGSITIMNKTNSDISELRLFYKNQLDTGEYVGGIAYTVKITDLKANSSQTVQPSHYDTEYGVVMMVRIYE